MVVAVVMVVLCLIDSPAGFSRLRRCGAVRHSTRWLMFFACS